VREYVAIHGCARALTTAVVAVMVAVSDRSGPSAYEGRGRCVRAHEATAQRLVLDSVGSVEIIVQEEDEGLS